MNEKLTKQNATASGATTSDAKKVDETPFEAVASICSVLVVGLFILTFLSQNFVIPSGSMENTLMVGDHLLVDRITLAPPAKWMPLMHYREPKRGDVMVFIKPVPDTDPAVNGGEPSYLFLVKRLVAVPGDRLHLRNGIVYINGVPQPPPKEGDDSPATLSDRTFLDEFPSIPPIEQPYVAATVPEWALESAKDIKDGDLVIPDGMYFMMGDHRHNSLDSRYWGFVPRQNIVGRPLFNYWSFKTSEEQYNQTGLVSKVSWLGHVAIHFFTDTRWSRTLKIIH